MSFFFGLAGQIRIVFAPLVVPSLDACAAYFFWFRCDDCPRLDGIGLGDCYGLRTSITADATPGTETAARAMVLTMAVRILLLSISGASLVAGSDDATILRPASSAE